MKKIFAIALKELGAYFASPIAYIVLILTITTFNVFFYMIIEQNREATLRDMFKLMEFMFIFIIPLLTMRIFAEEKRSGTIEFLMTSPVSPSEIVLGKYFGALAFFSILLAMTGVYYFIIDFFAKPAQAELLIGYLGAWLEGALFLAIGLWLSSLTKSQIIAALSSYVTLFFLYFSVTFIKYFKDSTQVLIQYMSVWSHTQNLFSGLILTEDLMYFASGIVFFLLLTRLSLNNR